MNTPLIGVLAAVAVTFAGSVRAVPAVAACPPPAFCEPPVNRQLADSPWPIAHRNSYQQDSSALPGPDASDTPVVQRMAAPLGAITLAYGKRYADGSYPVWSSTLLGVVKAVQGTGGIRMVDQRLFIPDLSGGLFTAISGAYAFADNRGSFFAAGQRVIRRFREVRPGDPSSPIPDEALAPGDVVSGMNLAYDGTVIAVSKRGTVMALDRGLKRFSYVKLPPEEISNSIAVDEEGGIFVVAERTLRRVQWTGSKLSTDPADGAWSAPYDGGPVPPAPGRLGAGSGTTPTLVGHGGGDRLVAIADGGELMKIAYFWRSTIPADWKGLPGRDRRLAGELPITFGDPGATRSATEQSLVARGYDTMAVSNTYGFPFNVTTPFSQLAVLFSGLPGVQPFGVEKFRWNPVANTLTRAWANRNVSCPNGIPAMSASRGLAYCWGARNGWWTLEALDWETGRSVFHRVVGSEAYDNSAYAGLQIGPWGSAATGVLGGVDLIRPTP
jgi:hypothetical protein